MIRFDKFLTLMSLNYIKCSIRANGTKPSSDIESISCRDIMSGHQRAQRSGLESMYLTLN